MIRFALIFLIACSSSSASKLDEAAPSRNFVCERVKLKDPKATCVPEYSGEGPGLLHSARVTQGENTAACGVTVGQLGVTCDALFVAPAQPKPPSPPAPVEAKK
jgi:hypothetical protein